MSMLRCSNRNPEQASKLVTQRPGLVSERLAAPPIIYDAVVDVAKAMMHITGDRWKLLQIGRRAAVVIRYSAYLGMAAIQAIC
jgi:hypothetical protein